MSQPALVYGIGATKAGTSWLHIYLSQHPECHMRAVKELHYFDTLNQTKWRDEIPLRRLLHLANKRETASIANKAKIDLQIADFSDWQEMLFNPMGDHSNYVSYLEKGLTSEKIVGDITPAYSLISPDALSEIVALPREVKFIYLLRDPLERLWSNVRLAAVRAGAKGSKFVGACADILNQALSGDHRDIETRSDYAAAVTKIDQVVAPKNVLFEFYENLFTDGAVQRIADFLGITAVAGKFDKIVNVGKKLSMNADQRSRALVWLQPQYDFVLRRFSGQVPNSWHVQSGEV